MQSDWKTPAIVLALIGIIITALAFGRDLFNITFVPAPPIQGASPGPTTDTEKIIRKSTTFRAVSLNSFQQIQGQPQWVGSQQQKLLDSVVKFSTDGTMSYNTTNVRTDLYPVPGRFSDSAQRVSFRANNSATNNASVNFVQIDGTIEIVDGKYIMNVSISTGSGTSAEINGQPLGATSRADYKGTVTVQPS